MSAPCSAFDLLLMVYADGEATTDERSRVDVHLASCAHCRARLAEWQALTTRTDALLKRPVVSGQAPPLWRPPESPVARPLATQAGESASPRQLPGDHTTPNAPQSLLVALLLSVATLIFLPSVIARRHSGPAAQAVPAAVATMPPSKDAKAQNLATAVAARTSEAPPPVVGIAPPMLSVSASATATPSAPEVALTGTIAYVRGGDVRLRTPSGDTPLTTTGRATAPRWSPSGRWLLYEAIGAGHAAQLRLVRPASGQPPIPLPAAVASGLARWSPTRDEVAVAPANGSLWLVAPGEHAATQLLPAGGQVTNLTWSPDGAQIAVERRNVDGLLQSLWLVTRAGAVSHLTPMSSAEGNVPVLGSWAPGNAHLTFWQSDSEFSPPSTPQPLALWSTGGTMRRLLNNVLMYRDFLSWSPDGQALAVVESVAAGNERLGQITVVPIAAGAAPHRLTDPGRADGDVAWSPDGALIAYASSPAPPQPAGPAVRQIWVEAPDGSGRRPITPGAHDSFPQWSRDGSRILYVHQTATGAELWLVGRDGADPHPVVRGLPSIGRLPRQDFGASGLVSYRGVFDWTDAAQRN